MQDRLIERYFSEDLLGEFGNIDVYSAFKWKKVDVEIKDFSTGDVIYEGHGLEFPEHYSQQACDIIASKYFFRNIDGKGTSETSLKQVVHRMVCFWTEALIDEGVINNGVLDKDFYDIIDYTIPINIFSGEAGIFYDECVYTLLNQMWAPNSPQWFNTGIRYYGIKGDPDDMYYFNEKGLHISLDRYSRSQTSACFIIPVTDHLIGTNSITDHFVTETKLFKGGSGVGTNFSPIRAEGESLSTGGHSSGVMSFLLGLDRNAGAIKSGGTTRRAAKMVILDIDHPDIEEFIDWKVKEEKKVRDLISLGYDGSMNGEAYQTVSGQNSNNSVRVSKEFMDKILGIDLNPKFMLKGRKDSNKDKEVDALELWDKIAYAAWDCADPGIQFDDRYNEWHTAPRAGKINATNPCSEYAFIDNSACNLASINVLKLTDKGFNNTDPNAQYDIITEKLMKLTNLVQLVLEASIQWGQFPTKEVAENSYLFRPTGLGLCNLGAFFLSCSHPYDSDDAREWAKHLAGVMTGQSYLTSCKIAEKVGACVGFEDNKEAFVEVLKKHQSYLDPSSTEWELFNKAIFMTYCSGVRNMQTTVMAPTGTISLAMDCATTGIEPFFSHRMYKKCSDGSVMIMTNPLAKNYLTSYEFLDLEPHEIEIIEDYFDDYNTFQDAPYLDEHDQAVLATANEISPLGHLRMMAAIQPLISGSISKTVNLPNSATVEDIKDIYEQAYVLGLKSVSIYRDGSKGSQPLTAKLDEENEEKDELDLDGFDYSSLDGFDYSSVIVTDTGDINLKGVIEEGQSIIIHREGQYIAFNSTEDLEKIDINKENDRHSNDTNCMCSCSNDSAPKLERVKPDGIRQSTTHTAKIGNVEIYITISYYEDGRLCEIFVSSDKEGTTIKGLLSSLSKSISHMLQYGVEPEKIATMLRNQQYEPAGYVERHPYIKMATSISDLIARVIEYECGDYSRTQLKPVVDNMMEELRHPEQETTIVLEGYGGKSFDEYKDTNEYTGSECSICHGTRMVRNGSCELCLDCGNTSGCS